MKVENHLKAHKAVKQLSVRGRIHGFTASNSSGSIYLLIFKQIKWVQI